MDKLIFSAATAEFCQHLEKNSDFREKSFWDSSEVEVIGPNLFEYISLNKLGNKNYLTQF